MRISTAADIASASLRFALSRAVPRVCAALALACAAAAILTVAGAALFVIVGSMPENPVREWLSSLLPVVDRTILGACDAFGWGECGHTARSFICIALFLCSALLTIPIMIGISVSRLAARTSRAGGGRAMEDLAAAYREAMAQREGASLEKEVPRAQAPPAPTPSL